MTEDDILADLVKQCENLLAEQAQLTARLESVDSELRSVRFIIRNLRGSMIAREISDNAARRYGLL